MQAVSKCPKCGCSYSWTMNQVEQSPDGGVRPALSPNCPKCKYDVTGTNDRATRNFHFFAKRDDASGMQKLLRSLDINAPADGQSYHPLVVAAIYGSEKATKFLLKNGADPAQIPLALGKAKEFGHPGVTRLLTAYSKSAEEGTKKVFPRSTEKIQSLIGKYSVTCQDCGHRFERKVEFADDDSFSIRFLPDICPKCSGKNVGEYVKAKPPQKVVDKVPAVTSSDDEEQPVPKIIPKTPEERLQRIATLLLIIGCIEGAFAAIAAFIFDLTLLVAILPGERQGISSDIVILAVVYSIGVVRALVIIYGAIKMRSRGSYRNAIVTASFAAVPVGGCFILGLPVGIGALIVLTDSKIKELFSQDPKKNDVEAPVAQTSPDQDEKVIVACPKCGKRVNVARLNLGKKGKCKGCGVAYVLHTNEEDKKASDKVAPISTDSAATDTDTVAPVVPPKPDQDAKMITVVCPNCGKRGAVRGASLGKKGKCKSCGVPFVLCAMENDANAGKNTLPGTIEPARSSAKQESNGATSDSERDKTLPLKSAEESAFEALDTDRAKATILPLIEIVTRRGSDQWAVRRALQALVPLAPHAVVPLLLSALHINQINVEELQIYSACTLGDIRDPRAVDALMDALDYDDICIRFAAAKALGQIAGLNGADALPAIPRSWGADMKQYEPHFDRLLKEARNFFRPRYRKADWSSGERFAADAQDLSPNQALLLAEACRGFDARRVVIKLKDTPVNRQVKSAIEHIRHQRISAGDSDWVCTVRDLPAYNADYLVDLDERIKWGPDRVAEDRKQRILFATAEDQLLTELRTMRFFKKVGDKGMLAGFMLYPHLRDCTIVLESPAD